MLVCFFLPDLCFGSYVMSKSHLSIYWHYTRDPNFLKDNSQEKVSHLLDKLFL
jgi:hypothetical protein